MKKHYILLIILSISLFCSAQERYPDNKYAPDELKPLSRIDQQNLKMLPELKLPDQFKNTTLPYAVDNSTQPYMREMFCQSGLDCGQAASVAIGFTYEINRLRNLSSNSLSTTYPSYFTWNWENGGNGWYGASYYHSMEVLRMVGCPNLEVYGEEVNGGDNVRFMSGYENYLHGMENRIQGAYCIDVSNEEGLINFKHWLDHHHDGSDVGGVAFFYSQYQNPSNTLPAESEHAGDHVIISWGASPNHGMAIVGYNDSIKWDYNGDGLYTNHIDITGDGIVDLRDWEIGAVKMNNTYHSYPSYTWGEEGYSWMMYRTLALGNTNGGIWNKTVNVLIAKESYEPQLTMKINMSHNQREKIKMNVGMTTDLSSNEPMYILDFPIFDFQGANRNMQGGTNPGDETIEFGYDLSPFLNYLQPGQTAKYIFQLEERDEAEEGTGQLNSLSLIDYTSESPITTTYNQTNIPIIENGLLRLPIEATINFEPPVIETQDIPIATIYEPYTTTLNASNGTPPYKWSWDMDFEITTTNNSYPNISGTSLSTGANSWVEYELPFAFPFYDSTFSTVYIYKTGAIMMEQSPTDLPYNSDDDIVFFNRKMIAALYAEENGNIGAPAIEVIENSDNVHFKWSSSSYNFSIRLYQNGQIKIYYGNNDLSNLPIWVAGISSGDQKNHQMLGISNADFINDGLTINLEPHLLPEEFSISEDGIISGTPTEQYLAENLYIKVKDNNNLINKKNLAISTDGFIINYMSHTSDNDILEYGESATMDLTLINETGQSVTGVSCNLSCTHSGITITDATENFGDINVSETISINNAFAFDINYNFENGEVVDFIIDVNSDQESWQRAIQQTIFTPDIVTFNAIIDDGDNGRLDEGETVNYLLSVTNAGGADISDVNFQLSTNDTYISINENNDFLSQLDPEQQGQLQFNLSADISTPQGHVAPMTLFINNDNYQDSLTIYISTGLIVEDWETQDFNEFSWYMEGNENWHISDDTSYNASYCIESGNITHGQVSSLKIGTLVLSEDSIRFHRKVSCELDENNTNWDYLAFFIDGIEQVRWDGEKDWQQFSYPVNSGYRIFEWRYVKDGSVDAGADCAWIDDIIFPSIYDAPSQFTVSTDSIWKQMPIDTIDSDTILINNLGGGIIGYNIEIRNKPSTIPSNKSIENSTLSCTPENFIMGETIDLNIAVTNGSQDGEWIKQIIIDFPEGINVLSATDFYDTNDTLFSNGLLGEGIIISWFNETDAGWGVIQGGETATAQITVEIPEDYSENIELEYQLVGEFYGEEPHYINNVFSLENLGPPIEWLAISPNMGQAYQTNTDSIILHWNTYDMEPGFYEADINIYLENDTTIIPVALEITWPVNNTTPQISDIQLYPNPTSNILNIKLNDSNSAIQQIKIFNSYGKCIKFKNFKNKSKETIITIPISDLKSGVYIVSIETNNDSIRKKIIIL